MAVGLIERTNRLAASLFEAFLASDRCKIARTSALSALDCSVVDYNGDHG